MHINSVLSYLGAWDKLQLEYLREFQEIQQVIEALDNYTPSTERSDSLAESGRPLHYARFLTKLQRSEFARLGWKTETGAFQSRHRSHRQWEVSSVKSGVGIEFIFRGLAVAESSLFVNFPVFARAQRIQIAVVLVPMQSFARSIGNGIGSFEMVSARVPLCHNT